MRKTSWHDLGPRLMSAVVLVAVAAAGIAAGGRIFAFLIICAMAGMMLEALDLAREDRYGPRGLLAVGWVVMGGVCATIGRLDVMVVLASTGWLFRSRAWAGVMAVILAGGCLIALRLGTIAGPWSVVFPVAVVVCSDSLAYVTGRLIGGAKLAPRISPGKTWSGSAGGLAGAVMAGLVVSALAPSSHASVAATVVWSVVLGIAGQAGDLAESAVKRACGVKDSGTLLPGHGGLLDRFDALMAAAPLAWVLALISGPEVPFWTVTWSDLLRGLRIFVGMPG
ncbi:phosphatidate cytidylyltransferase [Acetobacter sp. AN02]|uniref:phosphatidate cytidylyltransferase n=1 Tax=Acetobacter sp. AN02 TaxID=2894186 RepID=UPI0024344A0A|nr:CDP-archaeol synthase [Acetobacter sp. AN02]MDG6094377.1 phosphatidate cytidylyltransferase [Acetobacter sp. AN02]